MAALPCIDGGGENGFAACGGSPLRGALCPSKTGGAAFCEPATLVRLASSAQIKRPALAGRAVFIWWRWRESNSRPQVLRYEVYMLIPSLISLQATRRAGKTHSQFSKDLTVRALNMPLPRSCVGDSCDPDAQARSGQKAFTGF